MAADARRHAHISHVSVGSSNARVTTVVRCFSAVPLFVEDLQRSRSGQVAVDGAFLTRILAHARGRRSLLETRPRHLLGAKGALATASVAMPSAFAVQTYASSDSDEKVGHVTLKSIYPKGFEANPRQLASLRNWKIEFSRRPSSLRDLGFFREPRSNTVIRARCFVDRRWSSAELRFGARARRRRAGSIPPPSSRPPRPSMESRG